MNLLYVTADRLGDGSGGGTVAKQERDAMVELMVPNAAVIHSVSQISRKELEAAAGRTATPEPWKWDEVACGLLPVEEGGLAHFYSGTFPRTVAALKSRGWKIAYTIAAHDREESRQEHINFGIDFDNLYPHLSGEGGGHLWERYIDGYRMADVIVCPGRAAEKAVRRYGGVFETKRIEIIPHGCELPEKVKPLPNTFTVGYMGSYGLDKGVIYLLKAWKQLAYRDAILVLAGRDSDKPWVRQMAIEHGGSNIVFLGWVRKVSDFYNKLSLYVQPSVTEGFGLEVLEAMAHGRPVICSEGAGACDVVPNQTFRFPPRDVDFLASRIDEARMKWNLRDAGDWGLETAKGLTWDKIRARYVKLWKELLR